MDETPTTNDIRPLADVAKEFERAYIERALETADGKRTRAAALLGISRKNLWEKCRALGIPNKAEQEPS